MRRNSPAFRRLAAALTLVRLVALVAAPVLESALVLAQSAASPAQETSAPLGTPAHNAASCPACQILQVHPVPPPGAAEITFATRVESPVAPAQTRPPEPTPTFGVRPRAPPPQFV